MKRGPLTRRCDFVSCALDAQVAFISPLLHKLHPQVHKTPVQTLAAPILVAHTYNQLNRSLQSA